MGLCGRIPRKLASLAFAGASHTLGFASLLRALPSDSRWWHCPQTPARRSRPPGLPLLLRSLAFSALYSSRRTRFSQARGHIRPDSTDYTAKSATFPTMCRESPQTAQSPYKYSANRSDKTDTSARYWRRFSPDTSESATKTTVSLYHTRLFELFSHHHGDIGTLFMRRRRPRNKHNVPISF